MIIFYVLKFSNGTPYRRYRGTQTVRAFKLLFSHGQLKHTSLSNYSSLYPKANFILISLLFFYKKNLWWRFRGLLIHSLVTPKNMEKSSLNFGDQPLKIEIEQNFYLSGQNRYLINSLNKASSVSNCCELKRNIVFLISHFTSFSLLYSLVALWITRVKKFFEGHSRNVLHMWKVLFSWSVNYGDATFF